MATATRRATASGSDRVTGGQESPAAMDRCIAVRNDATAQPQLFDGRYPRYTRQIGFFEGPIEEVLAFFDGWWLRMDKLHAVPRARPESLESILARGFTDWLLVECDRPWTALFVPELEGGPVHLAATMAGIRSVYIRDLPGEMLDFRVYDRDLQRVVMAYEDGGAGHSTSVASHSRSRRSSSTAPVASAIA